MIEYLAKAIHVLSGFCQSNENFKRDGLGLWEAK